MTAKTRRLIGSVLMTLAALQLGFVPLVVDINPSHVLNPTWPPHARLHVVWFLCVGGLVGLVMLYLIWLHRDRRSGRAIAAALLSSLPFGFYLASATDSLYGGILIDPTTQSQLPFNDVIFGVSANLFTLTVGWLYGMLGFALTRSKDVGASNEVGAGSE